MLERSQSQCTTESVMWYKGKWGLSLAGRHVLVSHASEPAHTGSHAHLDHVQRGHGEPAIGSIGCAAAQLIQQVNVV